MTLTGSYPELPCEPLSFAGVRAQPPDEQHGHAEAGWALTPAAAAATRLAADAKPSWTKERGRADAGWTLTAGTAPPAPAPPLRWTRECGYPDAGWTLAPRAALAPPNFADASNATASAATLKSLVLNFPTGRATKTNCFPPPDRRLRPSGRATKTNCVPPPDLRLSRRAGTNVGLAVRAGRGAREAAISSAAPPSRAARELREAVAASPTGRHERDKCDSGLSFTKFLSDVALVARDKSIRKERWGKTSNSSFANFEQPVERKAGTTEAQHAVFGVIEFENHTPEEFEELGDAKPVAAAMSPTLLRSRRSEVARTARVSHFRIRIRWI